MKTVLTTSPLEAAKYIKTGGIVAFPTETVYGLGANVFDEIAIKKIFAAKKRPSDNPLIAHVGNLDQINSLVSEITGTAERFIKAFFPGPLTLVLPKVPGVPFIATAGLDTIGVRMPRNKLAQEFLSACALPLVAPSANLSGKPSPTTWNAVFEDLDGRIDCILKGETTEIGLESTVVDCTGEFPLVLRSGAVTLKDLKRIIPSTEMYVDETPDKPRSPGLKHRHYSPAANVILVSIGELQAVHTTTSNAFIGIKKPDKDFDFIKICSSTENYAQSLFDFFRACDRDGIANIYCQRVEETDIGMAIMDRLKRAAA